MPTKVNPTLLSELAHHYTNVYGYQPCISKVCAYFMFDTAQQGITFDELLQYFEMSKSTVSAALKFLEEKKHIRHIMKADCRKRYFILDEYFLIDRYKVIEQNLIKEQELTAQLLNNYLQNGLSDPLIIERYHTIIQILTNNAASLQAAIHSLTAINLKSPIYNEHHS